MKTSWLVLAWIMLVASAVGQSIPKELWGKWIIRRELPASTISCWSEKEAKAILGSEIEYTAKSFRWKDNIEQHATADSAIVTADKFHDENSGRGSNSSQVSFGQLGIKKEAAKQVTIKHGLAVAMGAASEVPGEVVLLKSRNAIVFSVCNVYFEAKRVLPPSPSKEHR